MAIVIIRFVAILIAHKVSNNVANPEQNEE